MLRGRARPPAAHRARGAGARRGRAVPSASVTATGAPTLWAQGQTGRGVVVAVLDTGLAAGFPQFSTAPGAWFDPYDEHKTPFDEDAHGHGTEVAEIVAAMAPDVRVMAARVFSDGGRSTTSAVHRVFEWVLDPDGNPKTDDAPSVINGSWDDGQPGRCETEFDSDLAALRAAGIVPVFAAGNAGPGAATGASPASAPSAVAVGSVSGGRRRLVVLGPRPVALRQRRLPDARGLRRGHRDRRSRRVGDRLGHVVRRAAGDGRRRAARGHVPGRDPRRDHRCTRARRARRRALRAPTAIPARASSNVAQAAALLAGADHAGPRVTVNARWSQDAAHPGLVLSGRAHERGGGTSTGVSASAFIGAARRARRTLRARRDAARRHGVEARRVCSSRAQVRRLEDGRHSLFVRARDAAGNWGPVRMVVLPIDRLPPSVRASGVRRGDVVETTLLVHETELGPRDAALPRRGRAARRGAGTRSSRPRACT